MRKALKRRENMKKYLWIAVAFLLSGAVAQAETAKLNWVGCGIAKKAFMAALADAYTKKTGVNVTLSGGGATRGIRDVSAGTADLGGTCRHKILAPEEANAKLVPVGWDAIVAITHPSNTVKNITKDQLKAILTGTIKNWKELGGPDAPIKLAVRTGKISGVGRMTRELVFFDPEVDFSKDAKVLKSSGPIEKFVETDAHAIAVTGISSGRKRKVNFLNLEGIEPTYENIAKGVYPLHRPLYLVINKKPSKDVVAFASFATSPEGQEVIKAQGTVSLKDGNHLWKSYRETMKQARQVGNF
jgi:phosphate transport system substrate-binding protein